MTTTKLSAPSHRGKILAILIACALALACILPLGAQTSGIAAYAAADTKVTVTYQADENGFHVARQAVDIHPGLAAEYGYSYGSNVKASDLTALDALVAAHILIFGTDREDINGALSLYSGGFISMAFGSPDSVITFVNGAQSHTATGDATFYDSFNGVNSYTGDAVNQAVIKSGDLVEFFTIHDTDYWMDNFVWFEKGGAKAEKLAAAAGSTVELDAKGYMNWYALAVPADLAAKTEPIEDAALTEVEMDEDGGWRVGYFSDYGDPLDVSGDDGKLSLEAPDEVGTYYYSVYDDSEYAPLFSPWLELDVVDQPVMDVIEMISALPKNPDKGDAAAVEAAQAAYGALTAEQKNQLPAEYRQALQEAARKVDIALRSRTVSFDAGGGKLSGGASKAVLANEPYGALPTAARAGYDFDGWYTAKSGGTKVTASTTVAASEGVTLYAHWTAKKYKTALNANGGKAAAKSVTATYGAKYPALPKAARKGYTFKGWYTARSGGAKVGADTVANTAADHALYARWAANKYKVRFDANGGEGVGSAGGKSVTFGKKYGKLPAAKKDLKDFAGWFTKKSGGKKVTEGTKVATAKNATLYAHWSAAKAEVSNCNYLRIREDHSKAAQVLKIVEKGSRLTVLGEQDGWYKVKSGKVTGWVGKRYVEI